MLKSKSFLAIDFGAGSLKIAEFAPSADSGLRLLRFAVKPLGLAGSQDAARDALLKKERQEGVVAGEPLDRPVPGAPDARVADVRDEHAARLYERRLVLLRPDQHVAWRGDSEPADPVAVIDRVRGA